MATTTRDDQNQQQQSKQGGGMEGNLGSPISNEAYNVINALANKLEGLEAYRKYAKDGKQQVWEEVSDHERQGVMLLVDELERLVKDGKLRGEMQGMEKPKAKG
jgi:hypothetical protein